MKGRTAYEGFISHLLPQLSHFLVRCLNQVANDHRQARVYPHEILTQSLEDLHHLPSSQHKAWMIMSQREEAYF